MELVQELDVSKESENEMLSEFVTWMEEIQRKAAESDDSNTVEKINDLLIEARNSVIQVNVAFCGLFSAGKSSLINSLCESETKLATGAVPTTAHVDTVVMPGTDGHVLLLDTPGVDSTDESHQQATYNALHKADVVVLVMDYQHVEADDNLDLAREFSSQGKQLVLVVNQIDKHLDYELSFSQYQARIQQIFIDYAIEPDALFYTTSGLSPYNQLPILRSKLQSYEGIDKLSWLKQLQTRMLGLIEEHLDFISIEEREQIENAILEQYGRLPFDADEYERWTNEVNESISVIENEQQARERLLEQEIDYLAQAWLRFIDLAQIAPYDTTEKGRHYVDSLRPGFKVGWLSAKQKTAVEQLHRRAEFELDLAKRVETNLTLPLGNRIRTEAADLSWHPQTEDIPIEKLVLSISGEVLTGLVKVGAMSEQYPYQYVKDVVAYVKRIASSQIVAITDALRQTASEQFYASLKGTESEQVMGNLLQKQTVLQQLGNYKRKRQSEKNHLVKGQQME